MDKYGHKVFIKLSTNIVHDERIIPINFQDQGSKVKVRIDI